MRPNKSQERSRLAMICLIAGVIAFAKSDQAWSYVTKESKTPKELKDVKLEKGGLIQLNQYLKNNFQYNGKDHYRVEFICVPGKKFDD